MEKAITIEVIYLYLLIEKSLNKNTKPLLAFFESNTLFDIKTFDAIQKVLYEKCNIDTFRQIILKNKNNKDLIVHYGMKLKKIIIFYIKEILNNKKHLSKKTMLKKLASFIETLGQYEDMDVICYLKSVAEYFYKLINKQGLTLINKALYFFIEEYIELFTNSEEIIYNSKFVYDIFNEYFKYSSVVPDTLTFITNEDNIKILQNYLPQKCFDKILDLTGCKYVKLIPKYFFMGIDKKFFSKDGYGITKHEVGHLLNLIIYGFQNKILEYLYFKNTTVNPQILNNWLNEIIADIIGYILSGNNFISGINHIKECGETDSYPPTKFRKALLTNENYDFSFFKHKNLREIAELIYENKEEIKNILRIVK